MRSFVNCEFPVITCMIQAETMDECSAVVKNAIYDGAEGFGLQICQLALDQRTEENYTRLFHQMGNRPVYVTNYRTGFSAGDSDEMLFDELIKALRCGATMADIMGDSFDKNNFEFTDNAEAVKKQKNVIDKIHEMKKEVLMSSHIHTFMPAERVLELALKIEQRGVDVVKIVTGADCPEQEIENIRITVLLKKELRVPFVFLSNGTHNKIHRMVAPMFGGAMSLCVQRHDALSTKSQPTVKSTHELLYHTDWRY